MDALFSPLTADLIIRWAHVVFGIIWMGHLYFFNLVNVPFQGGLDKELKPKVNPALLLRAFYWFRTAAMWTFILGWVLFLWITEPLYAIGVGNPNSLIFLGILYGVAAIIYLAARIYRRSQGVDLDAIHAEIPAD